MKKKKIINIQESQMQSNIKILAVHIPLELSDKLFGNFSDNQFTITMADSLYSQTISKTIEYHHIILVKIDNDQYSANKLYTFCQSNPFVEIIGIHTENSFTKHEFIQAGLFDIVSENCSHDELMTVLLKAEKSQKNKVELSRLKQYVAMNFGFDNLIGDSKQMTQLKDKIKNWDEVEAYLKEVEKKDVELNDNPNVEYFDMEFLPRKLQLRTWRQGDIFKPIGMDGSVKISDLLTNLKVPLIDKQHVLVLSDRIDIFWVCGQRMGEKYKISSKSKSILRAEYVNPTMLG